jgi:class 3 adenylate cyclase
MGHGDAQRSPNVPGLVRSGGAHGYGNARGGARINCQMAQARFDLGFGVGIAHGYATLGRIGFEARLDYAAFGSVPNLASRLCDEAKDGQILIDGKVHAVVEAISQLEPVEEFKLKGFHRRIKASNVRAISG